jgi:hypothetical protein
MALADLCITIWLKPCFYLVRMFAQALDAMRSLPDVGREALRQWLDQVALVCHNFGYGVGDHLDALREGAAW